MEHGEAVSFRSIRSKRVKNKNAVKQVFYSVLKDFGYTLLDIALSGVISECICS
jgi:hypothetical protein